MSAVPGPVYGLEVPPGDVLIPASMGFPASFRITMAALDPTEEPEVDEEGNVPSVPRSTLRLVKRAYPGLDDEDEDDEIDEDDLKAMLGGSESEDEDEEDDEPNGGPSDPKKIEKRKQKNAIKKLIAATQEDEEMEDVKPNGVKSKGKSSGQGKGKGKGKGKATEEASGEKEEKEEDDGEDYDDDDDDDDDSDDSNEGVDLEKFVVCTLDTERNYQQLIDITINHGEKAFFVVTGTHAISLTGNYIMADEDESEDDDEDDYDYDSDKLAQAMDDADSEESDELDDVADPRVTEIESEDETPKLVEASKGKNKRLADEGAEETLNDMMGKAEGPKATKKQQHKKLKNNQGEPVAAEDAAKKDKKVQFAKTLEQGPTTTADKAKSVSKPSVGVKVVQGVTIDDRTIGKGRTVKNGDTVSMRYIGKLSNGQQFDANKKGKPFSFKVGKSSIIKGWDIGVVGMSIGGERRLTIPAHLGYGSRGMPGIPANSQLTFDVKLLEIK